MNILLIGEFSGVHNNLKKGLIELGHNVKLAADGDGFKNFDYDFRITPYKGRFIGKIKNVLYFILNKKKFVKYDIIQFIYPFSIPLYFWIFGIGNILFKNNSKKVYYVCGSDPVFLNSRNKFEYFPFDSKDSMELPKYNYLSMIFFRKFIREIDIIVPSMYSYGVGYFGNKKLSDPILLPSFSDISDTITISENNKIRILYGITRNEFKGSSFILPALNRIRIDFSDIVEVKIVTKLSFSEYIEEIKKTDILIDQCKSYDYGMNAILAMTKGVVVLSGAEKVSMRYLGINDTAIINIVPNSDFIYDEICKLLNNCNLHKLKIKSLRYVKKMHSFVDISKKFEIVYKSL